MFLQILIFLFANYFSTLIHGSGLEYQDPQVLLKGLRQPIVVGLKEKVLISKSSTALVVAAVSPLYQKDRTREGDSLSFKQKLLKYVEHTRLVETITEYQARRKNKFSSVSEESYAVMPFFKRFGSYAPHLINSFRYYYVHGGQYVVTNDQYDHSIIDPLDNFSRIWQSSQVDEQVYSAASDIDWQALLSIVPQEFTQDQAYSVLKTIYPHINGNFGVLRLGLATVGNCEYQKDFLMLKKMLPFQELIRLSSSIELYIQSCASFALYGNAEEYINNVDGFESLTSKEALKKVVNGFLVGPVSVDPDTFNKLYTSSIGHIPDSCLTNVMGIFDKILKQINGNSESCAEIIQTIKQLVALQQAIANDKNSIMDIECARSVLEYVHTSKPLDNLSVK